MTNTDRITAALNADTTDTNTTGDTTMTDTNTAAAAALTLSRETFNAAALPLVADMLRRVTENEDGHYTAAALLVNPHTGRLNAVTLNDPGHVMTPPAHTIITVDPDTAAMWTMGDVSTCEAAAAALLENGNGEIWRVYYDTVRAAVAEHR